MSPSPVMHSRPDVTNSTAVDHHSLHFCAFASPHLSQCWVSYLKSCFLCILHENNNKSNKHFTVCIGEMYFKPLIFLISTIFPLLCVLSVLVHSSYICPFPLSDLPSKQWFRRGSSHHLWPASLRPLHPHPPSGMDQWHRPAPGDPGLRHTAGALMHLTPPPDAMQHIFWFHYSSVLFLYSLSYGIFYSMILLCQESSFTVVTVSAFL